VSGSLPTALCICSVQKERRQARPRSDRGGSGVPTCRGRGLGWCGFNAEGEGGVYGGHLVRRVRVVAWAQGWVANA
jgi:hypothetical protein